MVKIAPQPAPFKPLVSVAGSPDKVTGASVPRSPSEDMVVDAKTPIVQKEMAGKCGPVSPWEQHTFPPLKASAKMLDMIRRQVDDCDTAEEEQMADIEEALRQIHEVTAVQKNISVNI